MLDIKGLRASAGEKEILTGIDLTVKAGEVHAIMGPNGSGKSTLAQVLAGHPAYAVTAGTVTFQGQDLLDMEPEERAQAGVFLAFQYPNEIPGVTIANGTTSGCNNQQAIQVKCVASAGSSAISTVGPSSRRSTGRRATAPPTRTRRSCRRP